METRLQDVWTSMPARLQRYNPANGSGDFVITVKTPVVGEDGEEDHYEVPILQHVPILFPAGAGGFRIAAPPKKGDTAIILFATRSIDRWLARGGIVEPGFGAQKHHVSDAMAIMGLRSFAEPMKNVPSDHASIGYDEGASIEFRPDEIRVGGDDADDGAVGQSALDHFIVALGQAITDQSSNAPGAAALTALLNKLNQGTIGAPKWNCGTSVTKVK